jgi:hypothetical protein
VVSDRCGVSSDDRVASASSSVGHWVQNVLLKSKIWNLICCELEEADAAASRKESKMAPLAATWPKGDQGLNSWNFKAVRRVDSNEVLRSDADMRVCSVRGPDDVRRANRPCKKYEASF